MDTVIDPATLLYMKYGGGGALLLLASVMVWFDKIDKGVFVTLLIGAAAAIGFQIAPGG